MKKLKPNNFIATEESMLQYFEKAKALQSSTERDWKVVTPGWAEQVLSHTYQNDDFQQRKIKPTLLKRIKEDQLNGQFKANGESIILDEYGRVMDGQHRLTSVVETGIPMICLVVTGIKTQEMSSIDRGMSRRPQDVLDVSGIEGNASILKEYFLLKRVWTENISYAGNNSYMSDEDLKELANSTHHNIPQMNRGENSVYCYEKVKVKVPGNECKPPSLFAGLFMHMKEKSPKQAEVFIDALVNGIGVQNPSDLTNPIVYLRNKLMLANQTKGTKINILNSRQKTMLTIKIWNKWIGKVKVNSKQGIKAGIKERIPKLVLPDFVQRSRKR